MINKQAPKVHDESQAKAKCFQTPYEAVAYPDAKILRRV